MFPVIMALIFVWLMIVLTYPLITLIVTGGIIVLLALVSAYLDHV